MEITVIIPTHKPQDYIFACLDSLAAQTLPKELFEVVLVLNGCDQPYRSRIEEYIAGNADGMNIRLIQTYTSGVSHARNMAMDTSDGKYIAFIDDDDFVSPDYLAELYSRASEDTVTICRPYAFNDGDISPVPYRPAELYAELAPKGRQSLLSARSLLHITCMKLIPRKIIGDRRFDTSFSVGEDTLMMFLISDRIRHVDFTSEGGVYYRRLRQGSAVSNFMKSKARSRIGNSMRLIFRYTGIFLSGIGRYSFIFYLTRVWGAMHSVVRI